MIPNIELCNFHMDLIHKFEVFKHKLRNQPKHVTKTKTKYKNVFSIQMTFVSSKQRFDPKVID